jgi:hypothetical protein
MPIGMITIRHGRAVVTCETVEEAAALLRRISSAEEDKEERGRSSSPLELVLRSMVGAENPWTRQGFWNFLDKLGDAQKRVLVLLVRKGKATDAELRKVADVQSNLELGGILTAISKQAAAINVPARAVFTIETETASGENKKKYAIAMDFLRMASEMNWPPVE